MQDSNIAELYNFTGSLVQVQVLRRDKRVVRKREFEAMQYIYAVTLCKLLR